MPQHRHRFGFTGQMQPNLTDAVHRAVSSIKVCQIEEDTTLHFVVTKRKQLGICKLPRRGKMNTLKTIHSERRPNLRPGTDKQQSQKTPELPQQTNAARNESTKLSSAYKPQSIRII